MPLTAERILRSPGCRRIGGPIRTGGRLHGARQPRPLAGLLLGHMPAQLRGRPRPLHGAPAAPVKLYSLAALSAPPGSGGVGPACAAAIYSPELSAGRSRDGTPARRPGP